MASIPGQPEPNPQDLAAFGAPSSKGTGMAPNQSDLAEFGAPPTGPDSSSDTGEFWDTKTGKALKTTAKVLDYPGGLVRTAVAGVAGAANDQDMTAAFHGEAPNSAEYLRRMGVSEGGSLPLPGGGKVTLRGAEGLAFDVLSDPLTSIAKAIKGAPYIAKLFEAPGKASEALGEAIYKSAITAKKGPEMAEKAANAGQSLIEAGAPIGGQAKLAQRIADNATAMGKVRQGLYDQFTQAGGKISFGTDSFPRAQAVIDKYKEAFPEMADAFQKQIDGYTSRGFMSIDAASQLKTGLYNELPAAAFNGTKGLKNPAKFYKAALAGDLKDVIVTQGNKVASGLGDAIDHVNDKWGALLEAKPIADPMTGALGKSIDAAALVFGGLKGYAAKKAVEMGLGPGGRTTIGKALIEAGKNDLANRLVRQGMIQPTQPEAPDEGQ